MIVAVANDGSILGSGSDADHLMKKKQCEKLCRQVLPHLSQFTYIDRMVYAQPMNHILRGFFFDDSGFDRELFFVEAFCMPLYLPSEHIHFTFGDRLRYKGNEGWRLDDPNLIDKLLQVLKNEGLPFLATVREPLAFAKYAEQLASYSVNPHVLDAVGCSYLFANKLPEAAASLNRLLGIVNPKIGWEDEIGQRANFLLNMLESDPDKARQTLEAWERQSIENFRLANES